MKDFMIYFNGATEKFVALSLGKKVVIFIVGAFLFILIVILLNPPKKLAEMRNSSRRSDVISLVNAAYQYNKDNNGKLLELLSETPKTICNTSGASCGDFIDLSEIVTAKKYIKKIPTDPKEKTQNSSGYQISKSPNGRINVTALNAERGAIINSSK